MLRILIIGYGNPLRCDDGFGFHAAERLLSCERDREALTSVAFEHNSKVEICARHQLTLDLSETASHFDLLIFIDAAANLAPGELKCQKVSYQDSSMIESVNFSHFLTPAALLVLTKELYTKSPEAYCVSVGGKSFAQGDLLSPVVEAAFDPLLAKLRTLIAMHPSI